MAASTSRSGAEGTNTDHFYSPANFQFYVTSPYKPLPSIPYHIRLLNVTRDPNNNVLHCELTEGIPLREIAGDYTAISYCAGDPKNTRTLVINGAPFNAFANLVQAVEDTCRYLPQNETSGCEKVSIWVDQICINQSDPKERAEQVIIMYEIYQSAREVAVCLTTHDYAQKLARGRIDRAVECIKQVRREVQDLDNTLTSSHHHDLESWESVCRDMQVRVELTLDYLRDRIRDKSFALGWLNVVHVQKMPWFMRAWVIQEYAANPKAVFLYANESIPAHDFAAVFLTYLWTPRTSAIIESKIAQLHNLDGSFVPDHVHRSQLEETKARWFPAHSPEQKVYNTLRAKSYLSKGRHSLMDLLDHSRMSTTSDARDHIYSCLGLAQRSYGIRPYYGSDLSVEDLFTRVMRVILLHTNDINLILRASTAVGDHDAKLSSWVPDWRKPITRNDADYYHDRYDADVLAGGKTQAYIAFSDCGKVLITKGVRVDVLVCETRPGVWQGERVEEIRAFSAPYSLQPQPDAHVSAYPPEAGDEVWVLFGAVVPVLLRRKEKGYLFLRRVYVRAVESWEVGNGQWMDCGVDLQEDVQLLSIV